jgi:hypothetical protein
MGELVHVPVHHVTVGAERTHPQAARP